VLDHGVESFATMTTTGVAVISVAAATLFSHSAKAVLPPPPPVAGLVDLSKVKNALYTLPLPLRYFISGNIGNVLFFGCEKAVVHYLNQASSLPAFVSKHQDNVSFFLGYLLHIIGQHYLHAVIVYGLESIDTRAKYFKTLGGMYAALIVSAIGSTILNAFFLNMGLHKTVAFVSTLLTFAFINYFVIGWIVKKSSETEAPLKTNVRGGASLPEASSLRDWVRSMGRPVQVSESETMKIPPLSEL
jgi:hypothetical protein